MGKDDLYRIVRAGLHVGLVDWRVFLVEKWLKGK